MQHSSGANWPCSVADVAELIGDSWTPLVLRDALQGVRRFDDFRYSLGISRNILSTRLRKLVDAGVLRTRLYQDNPPRNEYLLTSKGRDLFKIIAAMMAWGDEWLNDGARPPIVLRHHNCGEHVHAETVCSHCGEPMASSDVDFKLGPGFPAKIANRPDIRLRFGDRTHP